MIYFISGVWKDANDVITHVMLHEVDTTTAIPTFEAGVKTSESRVIQLCGQGHEVHTIIWPYSGKYWTIKAKVNPVINRTTGKVYLRSVKDNTGKDNLDNLVNFDNLVSGV